MLAAKTRLLTPHYTTDQNTRLALVLPGDFCMDTIATMRASYPELVPTQIVFVEREKETYESICTNAPKAVNKYFPGADIDIDIRHSEFSDVLSNWPDGQNVSYVDADLCGLPNAFGYGNNTKISIGQQLARFVQTHGHNDILFHGTFFRFGMRKGQAVRYANQIAKAAAPSDGAAFLFRQLYGRSQNQHKLLRFSACSWPKGRSFGSSVVSIEPEDRCVYKGQPEIADMHETVSFPIAPTKDEITSRAVQFAKSNTYSHKKLCV